MTGNDRAGNRENTKKGEKNTMSFLFKEDDLRVDKLLKEKKIT